MDGIPKTHANTKFGMKCIKCMLILINELYLLIAFLMISGATTLKVIFGEYYFELWYASTIDTLSSLWIATGCFLLALSIFGIAAAIKESTMMTNFTDGIVRESINSMMYRTTWYYERSTMDWVQETFHCCGNDGPSDWENFGRFATTTPSTTRDYYHTTSYYYDWQYSTYETETCSTTTPASTTTEFIGNRMPQSCCTRDSSYDNNSLRCQTYYTRGCHGPLLQIVSQSVMIWGSSALFIGIIQILGVVGAFMFARIIRRNKTNRAVQRWAIHESLGFDRPVYVDQLENTKGNGEEVKYI